MAEVSQFFKKRNKGDFRGGSGSGKFRRGKRIRKLKDVKKGMLLVDDSRQFRATNVLKVLEIPKGRDGFYGIFVDPNKPSVKRLGSDRKIFIWDFDLKSGEFHKAVRRRRR